MQKESLILCYLMEIELILALIMELKNMVRIDLLNKRNINSFSYFMKMTKMFANNLYAYLKNGIKGFPGLFRFIKLNIELDTEKTIRFKKDNPVLEIKQKLNSFNFDSNIKYLGIYISQINKDNPDPEKQGVYYKLKKILLEKDITSQVIYKDKIGIPDFNYFLPNIGIAILAKLGGIPWKLKRPIEDNLIIGVGAYRKNKKYLPWNNYYI